MPYIMKKSRWKWVALLLASFITFGDWYCVDTVAVLQNALKEQFGLAKDTRYIWFYTIIFLPNIIVPFFVGIIIDKTGLNNSMLAVIFVQSIG